MIHICIFIAVIYKFSHEEKSYLVVLPLIEKNLNVNLRYLILTFSLVIYLKLKIDEKFLFYTYKLTLEQSELSYK